ncbi:LysR substrate-binding domain-containing protein [Solirubrobacter taibaiensis]|nr:LysR substrate-binding domain-containing protein [Solirubrobacter taibaiensis]
MALDFRALRYFVAVAEELHFTRAAERLYIAQPALSEQIRRLERELGVELLRRTTRRVELTAAGVEFLSRARRILAEADEALTEAARAARGETGELRIATGATAGLALVPELLQAFGTARPQVRLELRQSDWEDYSGGVRTGTVDAAFVWLPLEHAGVRVLPLHAESRVAALAAHHPLAARESLVIADLVDEPWPWADTDPAALAFWTCAEHRGGAAAPRGPVIRSMEGLLEAVRAGLCVATVPRSQARATNWPGIVFRPLTGVAPATLALMWREDGETPVVQALVELARSVSSGAPDQ